MSRASGLVLILSGLAVAGYVLVPVEETGEPDLASSQSEIAKSPVADKVASAPSEAIAPAQPRPAFRPIPPAPTRIAEPTPVVVTIASRPGDTPPAPRVAIPKDRDTLVRELQKELKRVGCY